MLDIENKKFLENIVPNEVKRPSCEKLKKIKETSNENMKLIFKKVNSINENDDEEKRNIIVNLVSALDYYIHEIVIWGIEEITRNKFPKGKRYDKFLISVKHVKNFFEKKSLDKEELKKEIIDLLKRETYQKWKSIKEGLEYILPDNECKLIGKLTEGNSEEFKFPTSDLDLLNEKRNCIVHSYDRNYHDASKRNDIKNFNCEKYYNYIILVIDSIHDVISNYDKTKPEENEKEEDKEL